MDWQGGEEAGWTGGIERRRSQIDVGGMERRSQIEVGGWTGGGEEITDRGRRGGLVVERRSQIEVGGVDWWWRGDHR